MLNIDTLDNVIALVVVILLLSLIVQSIQGIIKKLLRVKSKQLEESLLDLFGTVFREIQEPRTRNAMAPRAFRPAPVTPADGKAAQLRDAVKEEMRKLGRVNAQGQFMLDSLSKTDLLNVIARVAPTWLDAGFVAKLQKALEAIRQIQSALKAVDDAGLPSEANAQFVKVKEALAPLKRHRDALVAGNLETDVVVADVLALREIVFGDTLDLLAKTQEAVAAQNGSPAVRTALAEVAKAISLTRETLDAAFGTFQTKLKEIETWFDTVMQSFEERYHRGMRTWSFFTALIVVIVLNANVFSIYSRIVESNVLRANLTGAGAKLMTLHDRVEEREAQLNQANSDGENLKKLIEADRAQIDQLVDQYSGFGFEPLRWRGVPPPMELLRTLLGWLLMAMLLTLGAPFWHDALESLFGVKNLLRRRTETRNVEQARGAGNPQS
jgi:hypothetical protein